MGEYDFGAGFKQRLGGALYRLPGDINYTELAGKLLRHHQAFCSSVRHPAGQVLKVDSAL